MAVDKEVLARIENSREDLAELALRPGQYFAPWGSERILADAVLGWYREEGMPARLMPITDVRANVVASLLGSGGGRSIIFNAHLDTEASGPEYDRLMAVPDPNRVGVSSARLDRGGPGRQARSWRAPVYRAPSPAGPRLRGDPPSAGRLSAARARAGDNRPIYGQADLRAAGPDLAGHRPRSRHDPGRRQLSRAHRGEPARHVAPKTRAALREIPISPQLATVLSEHRQSQLDARATDWVFPSAAGTAFGHRNAQRRVLRRAATRAGLEDGRWPPLRFHDLRHTFTSHLIIDLGLDVAQVSRILGHASVTITLDVYTHLFDQVRHADDIKAKMAASAFTALIEAPSTSEADVVPLREAKPRLSARRRAALRWST